MSDFVIINKLINNYSAIVPFRDTLKDVKQRLNKAQNPYIQRYNGLLVVPPDFNIHGLEGLKWAQRES